MTEKKNLSCAALLSNMILISITIAISACGSSFRGAGG